MGGRRVLVIEDEAPAREALESLLREEGYVVRSAPSGEAGLESSVEFRPHVIVCDYHLPDIDGLQVLRRIRESASDSVRFIMITAGLSGAENERALRHEADAYFGKPINLSELSQALRIHDPPADGAPFLNATA